MLLVKPNNRARDCLNLIAWTKIIPQFESLKRDDQVYLVQSAWNEITIADIAHKSIDYEVHKIVNQECI